MRPVVRVGQPRWEIDLSPLIPAGWLVGQALLIRTGDRASLYLQMRATAVVDGVLFTLPPGTRPASPIGGELKNGTTSFIAAHLLLTNGGALTAYGSATSSSWCYWTASWDVVSPHTVPA